MDQWPKTTSHKERNSDNLQHGELRSCRGSRLVKFFPTGESFFIIFFILTSSPTAGDSSVREREDVTNNNISPVPVSELVDDCSRRPDETQANKNPKTNKKETTTTRGDPLCSDNSEIPEWLQEFREILVDDEVPLQGGSHASSNTMFILIFPKTEIARSASGPKSQGLRAEDAKAKPYLMLTILVS